MTVTVAANTFLYRQRLLQGVLVRFIDNERRSLDGDPESVIDDGRIIDLRGNGF